MSIARYDSSHRMSQVVTHQNTVYLAGQIADLYEFPTNVSAQTQSVLSKIDKLLISAGTSKERILSATIYLSDIEADFEAMNNVWDAWLPEGCAPARATLQAKLFQDDILVEVSVIAAL